MHFKVFETIQKEKQIGYGLIKVVNFKTLILKNWLKDINIEMYSMYSTQGKSVVAERFIRTLKNKIHKQMTATFKNVYFNVLNDAVDEYNNTYQRTIKMKPIDVKSNSFAKYNEEFTEKDLKFKAGNHVIISNYKNIFDKGYVLNWSEEIFVVKK